MNGDWIAVDAGHDAVEVILRMRRRAATATDTAADARDDQRQGAQAHAGMMLAHGLTGERPGGAARPGFQLFTARQGLQDAVELREQSS